MSVPGSRAVLPLLPAPPTGPLFDALDDGEPGRALELLPAADLDEAQAAGVRDLAMALRVEWGPGSGSYYPAGVTPSMPQPPLLPDPVANWWGRTLPCLLGFRVAPPPDDEALAAVRRWFEDCTAVGEGPLPDVRVQVLVRVASLARRQGRPGVAAPLFAQAAALAEAPAAGPYAVAAVLLEQGDALLLPTGSPDALGYDPEQPCQPRRVGDPDAAEEQYRRAAAVLPDGPHERVALALRRAAVADVRGRHDDAVAVLAPAAAEATGADHVLLRVLLVRAQVLTGDLGAAHPGPFEEIASWAEGRGSVSYAQGCAAVLHASGIEALAGRRLEDARVLLGLALRAATRLGAPAAELEIAEQLAVLYRTVNAVGAATAVQEDAWARWNLVAGSLGPIAQYAWLQVARQAAGLADLVPDAVDPDLVRFLATRIDHLIAAAPTEGDPWSSEKAAEFVASQTSALRTIRRRLTTVVDLATARMNENLGRDSYVATYYDRALAGVGDDVELELMVLAASRRATALAERLAELGPLVGDGPAQLWLLAGHPEEALAVLERTGTVTPPAEQPQWDPFTLRAEIALGQGRPDEARALAEAGLTRFAAEFARMSSDAWRVAMLDSTSSRWLHHAAVLAALGPAETLRAADRTRSLALGALVAEEFDAVSFTPAVRARREAEATWNGAFDRRRAVWKARSAKADDHTAEDLAAAEATLDVALTIDRSRPVPLPETDVAQVADALDPDMLLLHLTATDDELVVSALTRDALDVRRHPVGRRAILGLAARVHAAWSDGSPAEAADLAAAAAALLEPVRELLEEHPRLLVVPDGTLQQLPFSALELGGQPLLARWAISQLPAASLVPHLAGHRRPRLERGTLVVGDPGSGAESLVGARAEAMVVAGLLDTDALIGGQATEPVVRDRLAGARGMVHLATHGMLDDDAPDFTSLLLADGQRLTVAELLGVRMDTDLVVLSACDTGRGEITQGGDVVGLARGVLAAGARSAVVTTWPVDDAAACLVMTGFACGLAAGECTAEALAAAQREVRGYASPERRARYTELMAGLGLDPEARQGGSRRVRPRAGEPAPSVPVDRGNGALPFWWAPFVHIGV